MPVRPAANVLSEEVKAGTSTRRQVLIGADEAPHFAMRRFIIEPGGSMPLHSNSVEHEQYVLRGKAEVGIGDELHEVQQGDVVYIPAGTPHYYKTQGNEPFEFLCVVPNLPDEIQILDKR